MKLKLIWPVALTLIIPLVVAYFVYENHLPPAFGIFPPTEVLGTPGFNGLYFAAIALVAIIITALYLKPAWFGFKPVPPTSAQTKSTESIALPWWFYAGAVFMLAFWWLMWSRSDAFGNLVYFAFSPMWWGFIVMLDGIVYSRTGGKSLITVRTSLFLISTLFSIGGWGYFEYFDYFVLGDWYYPNGHMPELSHSVIVAVFLIAYSTVWPAVFEFYTLLQTFPKLVNRYNNGPKIPMNGSLFVLLGIAVTIGMTIYPYPMFWGVWVGPMLIIIGQLTRLTIWTPLTSISQGQWSPFLLIALASLLTGFLWEMWNHGSESPNPLNPTDPTSPTNPNFWIYDIPYVNVIHLFSEMPLLGYFGYLPFGVFVWALYIWGGNLFGWRTDLDLTKSK